MTIHHEVRGHVAIVTIDRPERRNALDSQGLDDLAAAVESVSSDPHTRVMVLTGVDGNFCAGADLNAVEEAEFGQRVRSVLLAVKDTSFPTIAAVEGAALGAGTQLAVACDLRVATSDSRFGVPAARLGLMVDQWTVSRIVALAGQGPTRSMLLGGELMTGEAAHSVGFVHRLGGLDTALNWADEISALAPLTLAGHKLALNAIVDEGEGGDEFWAAYARAWASKDLQEGLSAFAERRRPVFHGR